MEEYPGLWLTVPTESIDGNHIIFVTGRSDVEKFRNNPKFSIRVDVTFSYKGQENPFNGMPNNEISLILKDITDNIVAAFTKDPIAVLTGIYTGDSERNWTFYTPSTHIFQRKFNEALAGFPLFPITISAENDPEWEEYKEMMSVLS